MSLRINPAKTVTGRFRPPSDKSLTHRAYMFGAIAEGKSRVLMPLRGEDCESTRHCLEAMGLSTAEVENGFELNPSPDWVQPMEPLNCGNSGTTMRLLSGLIASRPISATLIGDESLSRRPMKRIATPLKLMGAKIEGDHAPLTIHGGNLKAIDYMSPVASAQVKSAILLAGLRANGVTVVREPSLSRDHTERMLTFLGVAVQTSTLCDGTVQHVLEGSQKVQPFEFTVSGDISSAAFFLVAGALFGEEVVATELSLNPSRTGILDVFDQSGLAYEIDSPKLEMNEPSGNLVLHARKGEFKPFEISGDLVPRLVDEIPILAVLATQAEGTSIIKDAAELRVKETDRIETVAKHLRLMGAKVETFADGMSITGPTPLHGARVQAKGDHRIAMAFAIAGLIAEGETVIDGEESIATSYPGFLDDLHRLGTF
jgi:3-phosphoshikimate 1-carboxyvinyltransferase